VGRNMAECTIDILAIPYLISFQSGCLCVISTPPDIYIPMGSLFTSQCISATFSEQSYCENFRNMSVYMCVSEA
jgi:hypothetical protein